MIYLGTGAAIFSSVSALQSWRAPLTKVRYADVEGIGRFRWYPGDTTTADGSSVIEPTSGMNGRWKLTAFGSPATWLEPVDVVATDPLDLTGLENIDEVTGAAGLVVLATAQAAPAENRPWIMASGAWSAPAWFDTSGEALLGSVVVVKRGTDNGGRLWRLSNPVSGSITLGTTSLQWSRID